MINIRELTYTYPGESSPAVEELSFSINSGEIFGFLGPSGAGKSTTQKILIGLLAGWKGTVDLDGKRLGELGSSYYQNIGVSFEFPHFYMKFTARENLRFFASLYHKTGALKQNEIDQRIDSLLEEVGLLKDAEKRTGDFSKGMKMRLNLCRALIHEPEILYLDEPTSGLDPVNSRNIRKIINSFAEAGKTVFLTTHNMEVASELCNRVAFLNEGRLKVVETPKNLMLEHGSPEVRVEYQTGETTESSDFPLVDLGKNKRFYDLIKTAEIRTIHTREATLEDVFVKLTGRGLS